MKVANEGKSKIAYAKLVKRFLYITGCRSVISLSFNGLEPKFLSNFTVGILSQVCRTKLCFKILNIPNI